MQNQTLTRSDLLLLLKPVQTAERADGNLSKKIKLWGLLGALLFFASAQIPALLTYNQAAPSSVQATQPTVESQILTEKNETENKTAPQEERSQFEYSNLSIKAPITWQIEYKNKEIQRHLENGLVHIKDSAEPGQKGTAIITGHSSNYFWAGGDYKTVFAPLLKANIGDTINIKHRGINYTYQITEVYEVDPSRVDLMNAKTDTDLRLITCTPLGSTKRRLIVDAIQTSPDRNNNTEFNGGLITAESLPKVR